MKKIDMLTPIGILIGISMVVFGVISSGGMSGFLAFIDVPSILIVLGGVFGTLLSNLFFQPIAAKLVGKTEHELFVKEVIIEGVIGLQAGQNSRFVQAKLKVFAPVEKRKLEEKREHVREA
ncbi:hypothetical protein [Priestia megaterium]|uniref:hypothetical protein n=1 Tax=Priestia megaterium TaxID=1404 RepID=UPI00177FF67F|nr:hypothetical protein [Priestia megaterium]MBD8842573.1 hypothetical protein [Priestia megaterium]